MFITKDIITKEIENTDKKIKKEKTILKTIVISILFIKFLYTTIQILWASHEKIVSNGIDKS